MSRHTVIQKTIVYVFSIALVLAVLSPLFRASQRDSYPLSTYPMFSHRRGVTWISRVLGVEKNGTAVPLPPNVVANDEVMQAAVAVRDAVQRGASGLQALCEQSAQRVRKQAEFAAIEGIEVVSEEFDPVQYFSESAAVPRQRKVHWRCEVDR